MRLFGKRTARQKEIRRSKAERRLAWYHRVVERLRFGPLTFLLLGALLTALVVNAGEDVLGLRVGQRVPREIRSRVSFHTENDDLTKEKKTQARESAGAYYALDTSLLQFIRGRLSNALQIAREAADPQTLRQRAAETKVVFDDAGLEEIMRIAGSPDSTTYHSAVDRAIRTLRDRPLVEPHELARRRTGINAFLVDPEQSTKREVPRDELLYSNKPEQVESVATAAATKFPRPLTETMRASLLQLLAGESEGTFRSLYRYDIRRSAEAAQAAEDGVSTQYDEFPVGTRLADAGPISAEELKNLKEEWTQFRNPDFGMQDVPTLAFLQEIHRLAAGAPWGRGLIVFLVVFGLGGYTILVHEKSLGGPRRRFATALTLLLALVLARAAYLHTSYLHLAVGVYAFAVALLAITSSRGPAYAAGGLLALMVALATRQDVSFVVILVAVSLVLFLGLHDLRNRGRIIAVGSLATLTAVVVTQSAGLVARQDFAFVFWNNTLWAGITTLAAAFIIEGILPGIERLFGVTTNMTLLEWCDPNKPLLRMLAAEAPGTYNHSLLVGTLAGAAADAIGTNGLLARTGAYYHDIGKINKPEYFVENQAMGVGNRHERLSPAMSHLIIIGHVKDGTEMAKEYGVPSRLHCFIPQHHGTNVVEYFYHAASQARKPGDPEISDEQFRYPGPKPQSREAAIVMLCDAVEGAVRAMPEPTPNRIEDTVDKIIQKRLMDGQLDECDMTFRELDIIRNSLVKSLSSIYHGRISYPRSEKEGETRSAS